MGYKSNVFKDANYWFFISLGGAGALALMDLLGNILHGWFFGIFLAAAFLYLLFNAVKRYQRVKKKKELMEKLPLFEAKRKEEIRRMVAENPGFQTFCYECIHFDRERSGCSLDLYNRTREIKLDPDDKYKYCLYWNVPADSKILEDADPGSDGAYLG
jgi:hypothetical protein